MKAPLASSQHGRTIEHHCRVFLCCTHNHLVREQNVLYNRYKHVLWNNIQACRVWTSQTSPSQGTLCMSEALFLVLPHYYFEEKLPKKSPQNVHGEHGTCLSATISEQLNDSTEMNPAPYNILFLRVRVERENKNPNDIILTFHWTLKTFPLQQWGHRESLRIEQVSWTNMPWNRK